MNFCENLSKYEIDLIRISFFSLSLLATVEDCLNWNISCDLFKQNNHNEGEGDGEKACIGQTVFFHSNYRSDWKSSRSYCGKIFHAYPGADLLYFSVKPNYDRDLMRFISIESEIWNQIYQNEYATSALCCPLLHQSSLFYHATKFKCKWMYNNEDIVPDIYVEIPAGDIKCRYLTVTIDSEFQIKFLRFVTQTISFLDGESILIHIIYLSSL